MFLKTLVLAATLMPCFLACKKNRNERGVKSENSGSEVSGAIAADRGTILGKVTDRASAILMTGPGKGEIDCVRSDQLVDGVPAADFYMRLSSMPQEITTGFLSRGVFRELIADPNGEKCKVISSILSKPRNFVAVNLRHDSVLRHVGNKLIEDLTIRILDWISADEVYPAFEFTSTTTKELGN